MKAIVYHDYCSPDGLTLRDIDKPVVDDGGVLIRVRAASVNPADWHRMTGTPYIARLEAGLRKPKRNIPGADVAGTVEAVGGGVTEFEPGDEVFGWTNGGAFAEFVSVPQTQLASKPADFSFEQVATMGTAAFTALQGLRDKGRLQPGHSVLINGASGGVGTFAVQIAKAFDADVTGVCSTPNVDVVRSIGADHVIDYTQQDFTESGQRFDLMLDIAGNRSLSDCRSVLKPTGIYMLVGGPKRRWLGPVPRLIRALVLSIVVSQKLGGFIAKDTREDLFFLRELLAAGKLTPVIDRTYRLSEVPEAFRYLGEGHARGKIVITI